MPKIMLINVTHAEESRVGIVADGVLSSFEIESFSREHLKGNIYKGVVHRIHPALEAAFVDIGAERDAFLPLDEICFKNLKNGGREGGNGDARRRPRINEVLKPGGEVLVQIVKEQFANKPPTLSTFYSLAGRYLVLLPGSDEAGISRRIEGTERARIRELIEKLEPPEGFGIIVRTVTGFDQGIRELHRDLTYLRRLWDSIQQSAATKRAPALVYREHDLVLRNIRDYFTPDIDEIYVDNDEVFQRAREFLRDVMPEKESVLRLYDGDQPIFSHFNVESQIETIYKRRVPLKSGGSIVIDGTEALTAIDVNSGRSVRGASQEDTAFRTNLEAATEIARQLRLRDLGGLVVIDFIDMRSPQHIGEVEKTLRGAMHSDKARHEIGRISQFGLLEISRQRLRPAAAATSYTACPMCEGHGLVRTTESAALVALRKIHHRVAQGDVAAVRVSLPPEVAVYLLNQKREDLAQLERRYATRIQIALNEQLMPHQSELDVRTRLEGEVPESPQLRLGGVAPIEAPAAAVSGDERAAPPAGPGPEAAVAAPRAADTDKNGKRKRRRRGRRRGRGRQAAAAIGEALSALGAHAGIRVEDAAVHTLLGEEPSAAPPPDERGAPAGADAAPVRADAPPPAAAPPAPEAEPAAETADAPTAAAAPRGSRGRQRRPRTSTPRTAKPRSTRQRAIASTAPGGDTAPGGGAARGRARHVGATGAEVPDGGTPAADVAAGTPTRKPARPRAVRAPGRKRRPSGSRAKSTTAKGLAEE
jgi:ribonuclease E